MRNTDVTAPKQRGTPFPPGVSGNPAGRPRGSRNRLADAFVTDLKTVWEEDGIEALRRCARDDATGFCRLIAGLMPKTLDVNVTGEIDVGDFAVRFRNAVEMLGNDVSQLRKPVRRIAARTIEHDDGGI